MVLKDLTKEDLDTIRKTLGTVKRIDLSVGSCYLKNASEVNIIHEIIGAKIAELMGINCAKYHFIRVNEFPQLLSEDLNNDGSFRTMHSLGVYQDSCSLYDLWFVLEQKYGDVTKEIYDLVKVYIFDILFMNIDRHGNNVGILFDKNGNRKITILDNEMILFYDMVSISSEDVMKNTCVLAYSELEHFFKVSSSEFIDLFMYYFRLFTPEYLEQILDDIEQECDWPFYKEDMISQYRKHYEALLEVIKPLIGVRNVRKIG